MFGEMDDRTFVEFLAAFWESRGWETGITERDEGVFMITGDRESGDRGLMLVVPDPDASVEGEMLQQVVSVLQGKGVEVGVAATRGSFSGDAEDIANANNIHLLDPDALEQTIVEEEEQDLVEEFSKKGGNSIVGRLPVEGLPTVSLPTGRDAIRPLVLVVVALAVVVGAVQFLGLGGTLGGVIAGLPLPDVGIGLGDGGGYTITAASLSSGNGTAVDVRWDARTQSTIVAPNGASFDAPEGKTFVVVAVNVSNPGSESTAFRANYLALSTQNTRYGNQPLQGASGQLPVLIEGESSASGYVVYTVPADSKSATLLGLPGPDVPPMTFERDRDLEFPVSR